MSALIEDYALIGDCRTGALVNRDGSIDWLCLPRFDSEACFASVLGDARNGRWRVAPAGTVTAVRRRYRPGTLVLETDFETADGEVRLTDFMPINEPNSSIVRLVTGLRGQVAMRMDLIMRFGFGRRVPWVTRAADGSLSAIAGPHLLALRTPAVHRGEDMTTVADFTVSEGETVPLVLTYGISHEQRPPAIDPSDALRRTEQFWTEWAGRCTYDGLWRDAVVGSLVALKALTYAPTGAIVAAPTTSIPERRGDGRNWDYRFCWLRDATLTLLSLMVAGYPDEAENWRQWLVRAVAGLPSQVQPLYSILGEDRLVELTLDWLPGYESAKPVRIGNAAHQQLQLDVFGEVMDALHHARRILGVNEASWALERELVDHLATLTDVPDQGIWEIRGRPRHLTHSKVMMWVAFDRAVSAVEHFGLDGSVERWRQLRDELHRTICEKAFDRDLGAFVQAYGSKHLDASCLLIPLVGFLPATDPRVVGTVKAIQQKLVVDGFVHRYDTTKVSDNLPPGEGAFLVCNFWLADNLILQGREEEGRRIFERLLAIRNDVGLLAEEFHVEARRQLGNFPQALSHLALVSTAYNLRDTRGPAHQRGKRAPTLADQ